MKGELKLLTGGAKVSKEYTFKITDEQGFCGEASIIFENGKFHRCTFPFHAHYTREQWKILALLEQQISALENNE